jgi:hypothetical protein
MPTAPMPLRDRHNHKSGQTDAGKSQRDKHSTSYYPAFVMVLVVLVFKLYSELTSRRHSERVHLSVCECIIEGTG